MVKSQRRAGVQRRPCSGCDPQQAEQLPYSDSTGPNDPIEEAFQRSLVKSEFRELLPGDSEAVRKGVADAPLHARVALAFAGSSGPSRAVRWPGFREFSGNELAAAVACGFGAPRPNEAPRRAAAQVSVPRAAPHNMHGSTRIRGVRREWVGAPRVRCLEAARGAESLGRPQGRRHACFPRC